MAGNAAPFEAPAAFRLKGMTLPNDWLVLEPLTWRLDPETGLPAKDNYGSGGNFGVGYVVGRGNRRAFLKAINLTRIMNRPDIIAAMTEITNEVNFEREIHRVCTDNRLSRVIHAVDGGEVSLGENMQDRVPYLILELADGDVRRTLRRLDEKYHTEWKLRSLHHAAVGLSQLHKHKIAHQDLKPSNVMRFNETDSFKLGDFGRSIKRDASSPHEKLLFPGDLGYAPPELLYSEMHPDWDNRRLGTDVYMLGGLLSWAFLGQAVTPMMLGSLAPEHRPASLLGTWVGTYRDALPYVRASFTQVSATFEEALPTWLRPALMPAFSQLAEPDPQLRGHPQNKTAPGRQFSLERYISLFNRLTHEAAIRARTDR